VGMSLFLARAAILCHFLAICASLLALTIAALISSSLSFFLSEKFDLAQLVSSDVQLLGVVLSFQMGWWSVGARWSDL
jgi:hypothetical protein